ncbi:hypothetical protein ScPMuIL_007046 [Solemya velum]
MNMIFQEGHSMCLYSVAAVLTGLMTVLILVKKMKSKVKILKPSYDFDESTDPEILIVGGGVLGCTLATVLGRDGRKVTVLERDMKEPDRIVGELLQPGGFNALKELGLADCCEGLDAHVTKGYMVHDIETKRSVHVPYPQDKDGNILCGRAFHHGRFIMNLRKAAQAEPKVTFVEGTAITMIEDNGTVTGMKFKRKDADQMEELHAPLTVIADGCFSKFRKHLVNETVRVPSQFVGVLMKDCPQAKANHAEIALADKNLALIYQISSKCTRILVDVRGPKPTNMKEHMKENVAPYLPEHVQPAFLEEVETGRMRVMPNSFLPAAPLEKPGVMVLGDALNMRHPLTGGGMSVVFNDVLLWRDLFKSLPNTKDYSAILSALRTFNRERKQHHSFVVNVLAQALYQLFSATSEDENVHAMKLACFEFFCLGEEWVRRPVELLSILNPKPHLLIGYFFLVAFYSFFHIFKKNPWWALHRSVYKSVMVLFKSCHIMFPLVWSELNTLIFS